MIWANRTFIFHLSFFAHSFYRGVLYASGKNIIEALSKIMPFWLKEKITEQNGVIYSFCSSLHPAKKSFIPNKILSATLC